MNGFDWNQMRGFIAAAETGSLSAAARQLGLTQPTLSRQVASLEEALGLTLFERIGKKLVLTETGLDLLHHGKSMAEAADALALVATGRSQTTEGLVSISAGDGMAVNVMPRIIAKIRDVAPQISIELVVSNALSDLRRREADIAIRHVAPQEPDLIGKKLRDAEARFYASESWIAKNGHPKKPDDVSGGDLVAYERTDRFVQYMQAFGLKVTPASFPVSSANTLACEHLTREGLGISPLMTEIADKTPGLVRVLEDLPPFTFPIWLVTHRELRTSRRIRLVFDILADELSKPF